MKQSGAPVMRKWSTIIKTIGKEIGIILIITILLLAFAMLVNQ
jgi:hypothetical protein